MVILSQEDLLIYQRAETAVREALGMLEQITEPATPLHDRALAIGRDLESLLAHLVRGPVEADPSPPTAS